MKYVKMMLTILFWMAAWLASAQQDDLNNYLRIAATNNPGLQARFNEYMAALEVSPRVKALPDPQVVFAYFINPVETRVGPQQFRISASQLFPWFGILAAKEKAAIEAAKAKYQLFKEQKAWLFNEVRGTYYNLYFNRKATEILLENIDILNSIQRLATSKVEAGLVSALDKYRIEMEINELNNRLALLKDREEALEVMFVSLINNETKETILIPDDLWRDDFPFTKQTALDSILINNPQLLSIGFQQATLLHRSVIAKRSGNPNIKVGLDYTFIGKDKDNVGGKDAFVFPSVGISIPLYRNKYKARVQEMHYLKAAKSSEKTNQINVLETLFENGWKDYNDAKRRIHLFEKQHDLSLKSIKILETNYATGNKDFEEILRMERAVLNYHLEKEKAVADKQAAISYLNYLMGK